MRNKKKINEKAARKLPGQATSGDSKRKLEYINANSMICQIKEKFNCLDVLNMFNIQAHSGKNLICPFHKEINPSFSLYDSARRFKCFGCEASGDCIDLFVMLSGMDIAAAIKYLAGLKFKSASTPFMPTVGKKLLTRTVPPALPTLNLKTDLKTFIADYNGKKYDELLAELGNLSSFKPVSTTDYKPSVEASAFLEALYGPEDHIFIGDIYDAKKQNHVMPRNAWTKLIEFNGVQHPFICLNPVNPEGAINDNGALSFRCKENVAKHKYTLLENDNVDLRDQAAFWLKMILKGFPVRTLTFSGNKSIHAVAETKPEEIEGLKAAFTKLGFDSRTFDPARQSRLPGYWREDKQKFQKLLYLRGTK